MHICEHFITIHNDLGYNALNSPRLENNNNKPRFEGFIYKFSTCKGPNIVHSAWCCGGCCFTHYPLLKHFLSLHNKPQGLVNWSRKTHENINAKLISCYGQLSLLLFSLLAVNTSSYLTFLLTSGSGVFKK
jgi:hypothetical protein